MNLYNLGLSGILAAQSRMATSGHNIVNDETEGYNRQRVLVSTAGATGTSNGFLGRGAQVDSVRRSYDGFLHRQLISAQRAGASLVAHGNQLNRIDSILADRTVGVAPAINRFFNSVDAVASAPADAAARQEMIGQASNLVTQINELSRFFEEQANEVNNQVTTTVAQINSYAERVRDLNKQIATAKATSPGQPPNDLYDQRDQLVTELNQLVGVRVSEQNDQFSLSVGKGQTLLSGDTVFPLQAVRSSFDPATIVVAYSSPTGVPGVTTPVQLRDDIMTGGSLGGLLQFRNESLTPLQNDLGKMAVGLAQAFNALHTQGRDLNGAAGLDFFALGAVTALSHSNNTGTAQIDAAFSNINNLTGNDYDIVFDGTNYTITRMPDNSVAYSGPGAWPLTVDGLDLTLSGAPAPGDHWMLQPTRHAASDLQLAITDPALIAAANTTGGTANGENALELAKLRNTKIMGNSTLSVNEAFSQLVNKSAIQAQSIGAASQAQVNLITESYEKNQAVSGVNLNEEYMNIQRYQEQFRAAAQVIDAGTVLFDTLLGLRQ